MFALFWCNVFLFFSGKIVDCLLSKFEKNVVFVFEVLVFIVLPVSLVFFFNGIWRYSVFGFVSGVACFPIYYTGVICRRFNLFKKKAKLSLFFVAVISFLLIFCLFQFFGFCDFLRVSLVGAFYSTYLLSFFCMIVLSLSFIYIVKFLNENFNFGLYFFRFYGRYTLCLLCLHAVILRFYMFRTDLLTASTSVSVLLWSTLLLSFFEILIYCLFIYAFSRYNFFKFLFGQGDIRHIV